MHDWHDALFFGSYNLHVDKVGCGGFQLGLVVSNTHNLVIFPLSSGLGKMHSQNGQVSDSKRTGKYLPCNTMDAVIIMCNMYQ